MRRQAKEKVYLETTVVSYLTAWRSPHLLMAAHQEATRIWWDEQKDNFDVFTSQVVLEEASAGDPDAVQRRLSALEGIPELDITDNARDLSKLLIANTPLPDKAQIDALHIAMATVHGMDYLLTWNCRHIANATFRHRIDAVCEFAGYRPPILCTPLELMEK